MNDKTHAYELRIDGPLLRRQRQWLLDTADKTTGNGRESLDGVIALLDEITDQAHDRHGIDCLLQEEPSTTVGVARSLAMFVLTNNQGVPATETALCEECYQDAANVAYAKEQGSQADDVDDLETFHADQTHHLICCICDRSTDGERNHGDEPEDRTSCGESISANEVPGGPAARQAGVEKLLAVVARQSKDENTVAIVECNRTATIANAAAFRDALRNAVSDWVGRTTDGHDAYAENGSDFNLGDLVQWDDDPTLLKFLKLHGIIGFAIQVFCDNTPAQGWTFDDKLLTDELADRLD